MRRSRSFGSVLTPPLAALLLVGCGAGDPLADETLDENVGEAADALNAYCSVKVVGKGTLDVETNYLPHVVHCENGGAPYEALKAQAIAARTYLYYKLNNAGQITDGQGDQVYSCGSGPTESQKKAVKETAGQILRHGGLTICSFFVAGDSTLSAPQCLGKDADAATEKYVTYNQGLSGDDVHPSTLGSLASPYNRGCMSQWGSRCLASSGKNASSILKFYYGADIQIAQASGPCVAADDDGDGIVNASDNCPKNANAGQTDTDKDGKGDACDTDVDNDGVADASDNCRTVKNAGQTDTDKDGKGDACDSDDDGDGKADDQDNCPTVANAGQVNTDGDAKGDACDGDDDGDGVADESDNCRTDKNPGQEDADGDGKGNACEADDDADGLTDDKDNCPADVNPEQEDLDGDAKGDACDDDVDGDGVPDETDNCRRVANADQKDVNADGKGDACQSDADEDGIPDVSDNCPVYDNAEQEDADGDGVGDACADADEDGVPDVTDNCPSEPNATQGDEDNDGVGDACTPPPGMEGGEGGGDSGSSSGGSGAATAESSGCSQSPRAPSSSGLLAGFVLALAALGRRPRGRVIRRG